MKKLLLLMLFVAFKLNAQQNLPNLDLKDLEGKSYSLTNDFKEKDKLYVFSFWATWCAPCISELEEINEHYEEKKESLNFEIIAVSLDDTRTQKRVKPLVNGKGWTYKILLDTNQDFKRAMSIVNPPYVVVVKNNKIVHVHNGYNPGEGEELLEKLGTL